MPETKPPSVPAVPPEETKPPSVPAVPPEETKPPSVPASKPSPRPAVAVPAKPVRHPPHVFVLSGSAKVGTAVLATYRCADKDCGKTQTGSPLKDVIGSLIRAGTGVANGRCVDCGATASSSQGKIVHGEACIRRLAAAL